MLSLFYCVKTNRYLILVFRSKIHHIPLHTNFKLVETIPHPLDDEKLPLKSSGSG